MELVGVRLAEAMQRGAVLVFAPDPERPIIRCLSPAAKRAVDPLLDPAVKPAAQALMRHVVAYRRTLLGLFGLNATEAPTAAEAAGGRRLIAEEMRLLDDLGPALADAVRAQVAADYLERTGCCPLCGGCRHAA
jgi:hypothetical protein